MRYKPKTVILIAIVLICTIITRVLFHYYTEKSFRKSARYNLEEIQHCTNELLLKNNKLNIDNFSSISNTYIDKALKVCSQKMRTTRTGDTFAFDLNTKEFVFDPSLDCYVKGGKQATKDSLCKLFKDKKSCVNAIKVMSMGYDSTDDTMLSWQFNDAEEWLEFKVLPYEKTGYDGMERGDNKITPHQIVVAQGIEEDEVFERYVVLKYAFYSFAFLIIVVILIFDLKDDKNDKK